jgi:hypothetical protein
MNIETYVSSAGVAGDLHKLLVIIFRDKKYCRLFRSGSIWSLKRCRKKLLKEIELTTGVNLCEKKISERS